MKTATQALTVNAAFLQEIKEGNLQLEEALSEFRAGVNGSEQAAAGQLVDLSSRLRDALARHFELEETFGYFDEAVGIAPRLAIRAETLLAEHASLLQAIGEIAELAQAAARHEGAHLFESIVLRCHAFCRRFREHERQENELIYQAFDEDIGVGD